MKSLNRKLIIAALAGGSLLVALAAHAQTPDPADPPHGGHEMGPGHMHEHGPMGGMMERLKLTDEQRKKIEDIHYTHQKRAITERAELETARLDLAHLMGADPPDGRAINAQIDHLAQLRAGLAKERVSGMLEVRSLLTPDQRKEWREMHGGGWRGMHGPGGMGHGMRGDSGQDDGDGSDGPEDGSDSM